MVATVKVRLYTTTQYLKTRLVLDNRLSCGRDPWNGEKQFYGLTDIQGFQMKIQEQEEAK